jgi:hypothetical protein
MSLERLRRTNREITVDCLRSIREFVSVSVVSAEFAETETGLLAGSSSTGGYNESGVIQQG